jgi:hypothetical protein
MFSGGVGSWYAMRRLRDTVNPDNLTLLFADTLIEDDDLYRFIGEAARDVVGDLVRVADGRTPWEVFEDTKFIGNSRVARCSHILKQDVCRKWLEANCEPARTTIYLGIGIWEKERFDRAAELWLPWICKAPLCDTDDPRVFTDPFMELERRGIRKPRLYGLGFPHNNCGGFCVKAGQVHFKRLLENMPERYRYHEEQEERLRGILGKDVSILRDRRGGTVKPLTMRTLRLRIRQNGSEAIDEEDSNRGCSCFSTPREEE